VLYNSFVPQKKVENKKPSYQFFREFFQHASRNPASWWGKRVRPLFGKRNKSKSTNIVVTYYVSDKSRSFRSVLLSRFYSQKRCPGCQGSREWWDFVEKRQWICAFSQSFIDVSKYWCAWSNRAFEINRLWMPITFICRNGFTIMMCCYT